MLISRLRKRRITTFHAPRATEYERNYVRPERQEDLHCLREILGKLFRGEDVLEVACGTGYWTKALARTARSVFATDVSERVLTLARTKNYGNATVNFLKADCYALPQFDALFTAGFGAFWWSRIPRVRLREFMTDFHSHLAAGAKVAFIDHRYFEGRSTPLFRAGVNGEADTFQMRTLHDGHVHKVRKNFPSPEELTEVVGEFGRDIEVTLFDHHWLLVYRTS